MIGHRQKSKSGNKNIANVMNIQLRWNVRSAAGKQLHSCSAGRYEQGESFRSDAWFLNGKALIVSIFFNKSFSFLCDNHKALGCDGVSADFHIVVHNLVEKGDGGCGVQRETTLNLADLFQIWAGCGLVMLRSKRD